MFLQAENDVPLCTINLNKGSVPIELLANNLPFHQLQWESLQNGRPFHRPKILAPYIWFRLTCTAPWCSGAPPAGAIYDDEDDYDDADGADSCGDWNNDHVDSADSALATDEVMKLPHRKRVNDVNKKSDMAT